MGLNQELEKKIGILDLKISEYKSILNENDNDIRDLERSKLALLKTLKSQTLAYLEGEKARLISQQESTERPTSVLLKYKSLKKDSARDELTLNTLESEYRVLLLEQARSPKPWKLITVPTVLEYPVAPNKKNITFIFTILGTIISILFAIYKDKKEDYAFVSKAIEKIFKSNIIFEINSKDNNEIDIVAKLISKNLTEHKEAKFFKIIALDKLDKKFFNEFKSKLKNYYESESILNMKDVFNQKDVKYALILLPWGTVKYSELKKINSILEIQNISIEGILLQK